MDNKNLKNLRLMREEITAAINSDNVVYNNLEKEADDLADQAERLHVQAAVVHEGYQRKTDLLKRIEKTIKLIEENEAREKAAEQRTCEDRAYEGQHTCHHNKEEKHECKCKDKKKDGPVVITLTGDDILHALDEVSLSDIFSSLLG